MLSGGNTSFFLTSGGNSLLVDCGFSIPSSLTSFGIPWQSISNVFLTHAHADHVNGLSPVLAANRYQLNRPRTSKPNLLSTAVFARNFWNRSLTLDLSSHDHAEVQTEAEGQDPASRPSSVWYTVTEPAEVDTFAGRDVYSFKVPGFTVEAFRTMHTPAAATSAMESAWSTGLLINNRIWISGDTRFDSELLAAYAPHATVMIHDATQWDLDPVHAPLGKLATLPISTKGKMWLTHLATGSDTEEFNTLVKSKGFRGLALSGTKFTVAN
jgi:ribonuclease BN (tRNA processing enzyme)